MTTAKALKEVPEFEPMTNSSTIADNTGSVVIAFYHERGESRIESFPVIAWKVSNDSSRPITVEEIDTPVYCIKLNTGLWLFPLDTSFTDEAKAMEYGKSLAKSRRER